MAASDVSETQQESQNSSASKSPSNGPESYEYRIPEWFSKGNIKTPADLAEHKFRTHFATCHDSSEEPNIDDNQDPKSQDSSVYEIPHDQLSELRDITFAAFVRDRDGNLPLKMSTLIVEAPSAESIEPSDEIVMHLAKDVGAALISIDLEDLEDLSEDFKYQDGKSSRETPSEDGAGSSTEEKSDAQHYFGVESKKHASDGALLRTNQAVSAIIKAAKENSRACVSTIPTGDDSPKDLPVFLHFRNLNRILMMDGRYRPLARFRDFVYERRKAGENLVLVVTLLTKEEPVSDGYFYDKSRMTRKLGGCNESYLQITPTLRQGAGSDNEDSQRYLTMVNTRRLKRVLRKRLANDGSMEFLHVISDWSDLGDLSGPLWKEDDLKRATVQIAGRTFKKPAAGLDDIEVVLRRLKLCKTRAPKPLSKSVEAAQYEKVDEKVEKTWEEKVESLKNNLNGCEKNLLDCVVNPEKIDSTYDDVIIDPESKETMKHLVSMSNFSPEAKSDLLLRQIRINGALLYGPPGTGKTHLSRAVAKESGMNMIAIDSASVQSQWVGETEKYIKAAFTLAAKFFPCVLFIDEVDSLFFRRAHSDKSWERSALTQFLQCLDGLVKDEKRPFVIAATNRPSDLDDAFHRRLPQKLYFKLPDAESRLKILRLFLKDEDVHESFDIEGLARFIEGYSGSDIRSLCGEAAMIWSIEQERGRIGNPLKERVKLCLEAGHFAKALQCIRPSVSKKALSEFANFAEQFNATTKDASVAIDEQLFTKPVVVSSETPLATP